ncbi:MAG: lysophospholipid acyltransferase family protein [Pirellulales bacterium]|nr:lysophospholipid acyltransferase family protein [Pirellulales bacterium]
MWRKRLSDYLVYLVVRALICVAQAMRIETGAAVARGLAWLLGDVLKIRRKVVEDNLRHAFPEWSDARRQAVIRQMWEHLFLLVLEVAHAPRKIHETNWRQYFSLRDVAPLVRHLLDDRATLIVTAHFGNFEVAGYVLGILGFPTHTVARTLDNPYLDRFVNRFRGKTGQYIIPKNGAFDQILAVLEQGGTLTLLADQYAGRKGCWVEFFGRPASAHKAIALLALDNDAPILVAGSRRVGGPLELELFLAATADVRHGNDDLGTVGQLTQWYTSQLETTIRQSPGQYWWLHRRWKDTRGLKKKKKKAA